MRIPIIVSSVLLLSLARGQQTDVLFIGNSYTGVNDLPNTFRQLALSLGDTVNVSSVTPGGYTFQGHTANASTLTAIASQPWDFVVLQEQSQLPSFPIGQVETECFPFAAQLVDSILANDSCTKPVFYMTWGRQNGDADNCDTWPPVCTYDGMQSLLRERYLQMAIDNDAFAAPAGVAWKHVREQYPMLNLYAGDGSHPSVAGTYVVANTMYATMFRTATTGASFTSGLAADTASFIQDIASSTVLDSLSTWNIGVNDPYAAFTDVFIENGLVQFYSDSPGSHWWSFGDGETSTEEDPLHYFLDWDDFTQNVLHAVTDDCGGTDTVVQTTWVYFESVPSHWSDPPVLATVSNAHLRLHNVRAGDLLRIQDPAGRDLGGSVATGPVVELPDLRGLVIWQVIRNGLIYQGRTTIF